MKAKWFPEKWRPAASTVGSAVISTAVTYGIWSSPTAILSGFVLIAHEYGHYFAGHSGGAKVSPPFFVPLGFVTIGATRIKGTKPGAEPKVAISGAIYGSLAILLAMGLLTTAGHKVMIPAVSMLLVYEIGWGILGSDGAKYRAAKKGM